MKASSVRAYFRVRPKGFVSGIRLLAAFASSVFLKAAMPSRFHSVGLLVRGSRNLRVTVDGIEFEVRPRTNDLDLISPKHEPVTTDWFRVRAGDIVVDVGAHIGRYTLKAATHKATVFAIEPDPWNFGLLEKNVRLNPPFNVILVPQAMTSKEGKLILSRAQKSNTGTSTVRVATPGGSSNSTTEGEICVPGRTLDDLVKSHGLSLIDWLKIDVEGHEIAVLEGARSALDITSRLILEVTDSTDEVCRRIVEEHGFGLVAIENGNPARTWLLMKG